MRNGQTRTQRSVTMPPGAVRVGTTNIFVFRIGTDRLTLDVNGEKMGETRHYGMSIRPGTDLRVRTDGIDVLWAGVTNAVVRGADIQTWLELPTQ